METNMHNTLEIAYIGLESAQPEQVAVYLTDIVGLMPSTAMPDGSPAWRADGKAYRLWVQAGSRNDAICVGFEVANADALHATVARLEGVGLRVAQGTAADKAARRVQELVRVTAPWGVDIELVTGLAEASVPFASPHFPDGFVTRGQGFGHAVFAVNGEVYEQSRRFALEGLGMRLSDWLRMPLGGGMEMQVSFFHCNPRHHSLAIACVPGPAPAQRLHHINFEVSQVQDVGQAYDRALQARATFANTLGQHVNDEMVSFYTTGPDGWRVEIGATGRVVGADWSDVREYDQISRWGHQPPEVLTGLLS